MDHNYLRARFREQADALLGLVGRVEQGEASPLRLPIIVEYGEIDDDVHTALTEKGASEGIGPGEVLRRGILQEMEDQGETAVTVIVQGAGVEDEEGEGFLT